MRGRKADFKSIITRRMAEAPSISVWTPSDFLDVAPRQAIDQTLSRLLAANIIQRVERGLYRIPQVNALTGEDTAPDVAAVIEAITREKKIRITVDTKSPDATADRVIAITSARLKPLTIGAIMIEFRQPGRKRRQTRASTPRKAPVRLTGDVGHGYEDVVAARFLLDLLSGTNLLGSTFGRVIRLDWQARDAGWLADDLAITCELREGQTRAAGISIKSNQQVNNSGFPPDFVALAWRQWLGRDTKRVFRQGTDAIVLATAELPGPLKAAWEALLTEILQTTPERMVARLAPDDGHGVQSSALQRTLFNSFSPPSGLEEALRPADVVRLLYDVRLIDFDFLASTSHDQNQAQLACQAILSSGKGNEAADLWRRLIGVAFEKRQAGGSLDLRGLLIELRNAFDLRDHPDFRADWTALDRVSQQAMERIQTSVADAGQLPRTDECSAIRSRLAAAGTCFLVGESGSGKSALAKQIASTDYPRVVWLTPSGLDHEGEIERDRALGLTHPLAQVLRLAPERSLLVFDGIETYGDRALRGAAKLIKEFAGPGAPHVDVVLTAQFAAAERKMRQLVLLGVSRDALQFTQVNRPTEHDVRDLLARFPNLRWVALRPELRSILTNLKILDWVARRLANHSEAEIQLDGGLTGLIDQLWEDWTEGAHENLARSHVLMNIAAAEGDSWSRGVPRTQIGYAEQAVLPVLVQADLVRLHEERVSFTHDLLGDWARLRIFVAEDPIRSPASKERVTSPRWQQAVRLFGQRLLEHSPADQERWRQAVTQVADDASADALMRDLFLDAVFLAPNAAELLSQAWDALTANKGRLLNRLLHRFLFVATLPDPNYVALAEGIEDAERFDHVFRIPFIPYWGALLAVLYGHRDDIARLAPHNGARICALWLRTTPPDLGQGRATPWRRQAAEIAVGIAKEIHSQNVEHGAYGGSGDRVIYDALLYAAQDIPGEVGDLCLELCGRRRLSDAVLARRDLARQKREAELRRSGTDSHPKRRGPMVAFTSGTYRKPWTDGPHRDIEQAFRLACLEAGPFSGLAKACPDVALEVLLAVNIEEPGREEVVGRSSLPELGLAYWHEGDPPAYFRGPFLPFLRQAPSQGLTFVLRLVNFATRRYCDERTWLETTAEGCVKRWYGDTSVFRWHHDWPLFHGAQVQSSLMALEQWLYEQLDQGANVEPWLARIMAESESLAFAGVLMDVGKRAPHLFAGVLRPLFFAWQIWYWDFQLATLRQTGVETVGYWGLQAPQLLALAKKWHQLPHRYEYLLGPDGAIPRTMLGHPEFDAFFEEVRKAWSAGLGHDGEPQHLRLLIERINPTNYKFEKSGKDIVPVAFQWPEDIDARNQEQLKQHHNEQLVAQLPWRCRSWLDGNKAVSFQATQSLWNILQAVDLGSLDLPDNSDGLIHCREDVFCPGIAILLTANRAWLIEEPARMAWCRSKLQATVDNPPAPHRYDSELSVGNLHWAAFAAECGVQLLAADPNDRLARQLVAAGVTAFNYHTTALTMTRAVRVRTQLAASFCEMMSLAIQWAGLRPLAIRPTEAALEAERIEFAERKASLLQAFVDGPVLAMPNLVEVNARARSEWLALHKKRFPGSSTRVRHGGRASSREVLSAENLGLDAHVMKFAFGWLDVRAADTPSDRASWLEIIRRCLRIVLDGLPEATSPEQEIDGLPNDFDDWVFQIVARAIPCLNTDEHSEELWRSILERGAVAHQWVERFFWHWFTDGLKASCNPTEFVRMWSAMISYALESPAWDPSKSIHYELDGIVVELLCFDQRWNALVQDETVAPIISALKDILAKAFQRWGAMPKVVNGFAGFAVLPGAQHLLLPGIHWISKSTSEFDTYDWKYGLEENVTEYLRIAWQREGQRIASDPELRRPFLSVLSILAARGSHAAIALRERVAAAEHL
jgi:hypothetical protein